jgi:ATP adenylyltransferase
MEGCSACDLAEGRMTLPGGRIHETAHWLVEHCVGPLGVGTLIVKPRRHVVRGAGLDPDDAGELGTVLCGACAAVDALAHPDQVYVTLSPAAPEVEAAADRLRDWFAGRHPAGHDPH